MFQAGFGPRHLHTEMWSAQIYLGAGGTDIQPAPAGGDRGQGTKGLGRDSHSPAPCFSRSLVELAGPELSFDSSVGSETKI